MAVVDALKTSLGIIIAWGIVLWLQWPEPFMAPLAVLVLQTPYLGASLRKGLMRVLGTLAGATLVLALIGVFVQEPWPLLVLISLVLMISVYQMRLSRYSYAWFMVALAVAVIAWDASSAPDQAFRAAVYRTSEAVIGILVVLMVNGILWPRTAGRSYLAKQRCALTGLAEHLRRTAAAVTAEAEAAAGTFAPMPKSLLRAPTELRELLAAAELDTGRFRRLRLTHEAEIQALTATLGSMMGVSENLRLAAAGRRAFLTPAQRQVLREALEQLAAAVEAVSTPGATLRSTGAFAPGPILAAAAVTAASPASASDSDSGSIRPSVEAALAEAEARRLRLLAGPSLAQQTAGDSALAHALTAQLEALAGNIRQLAEASAALGAGRTLPLRKLPPEPQIHWRTRFSLALPNALAMGLAFWILVPLWIGIQWPPEGLLAVVMALVLIGGHTLQKTSVLLPAKLTLIGFLLGIISTAPIYFLLLPRIDGFVELALVLFPVYFAIAYFLHATPPPYQAMFLRIGILALLLLNLEPQQVYDAVGYLNAALAIGTGMLVGIAALALVRGASAQEQLRHRIKALLSQLSSAQQALADLGDSSIATAISRYDQQLRVELQGLSELLPSTYTPQVPQNDRARIQALGDALQGLVTRFRGLQQARLRWGMTLRRQGLGSNLGLQLLRPFVSTVEALRNKLDDPAKPASVSALDAIVDEVRAELTRIDNYRRSEQVNPDNIYTLTIAGHYVAVIYALRELAAALDDLDWMAWRASRF